MNTDITRIIRSASSSGTDSTTFEVTDTPIAVRLFGAATAAIKMVHGDNQTAVTDDTGASVSLTAANPSFLVTRSGTYVLSSSAWGTAVAAVTACRVLTRHSRDTTVKAYQSSYRPQPRELAVEGDNTEVFSVDALPFHVVPVGASGTAALEYVLDGKTVAAKDDTGNAVVVGSGTPGLLVTEGGDYRFSGMGALGAGAALVLVPVFTPLEASVIAAGGDGGGGGGVSSVNGRTGAVTLSKSDVGLTNVNNTSDADKPISTATQAALDTKADSADVPTAPADIGAATAAQGTKADSAVQPADLSPYAKTADLALAGASVAANVVNADPTSLATVAASVDAVRDALVAAGLMAGGA